MSQSIPLPTVLTVVLLLVQFVLFLRTRIIRSKKALTWRDFMISAGEATLATGMLSYGINIIYLCAKGEVHFPPSLVETVDPILVVGLFLIAFWLWIFYKNMGGFRKKTL